MSRFPIFLVSALAIVLSSYATADVRGAARRAELTFTRADAHGYSVWIANADGSGARRIATRAYGGMLSSDGRWLAYSRLGKPSRSGLTPLYVTNLATGQRRRIGYVSGRQWSPAAVKLAISDASGLFVVDPASGRRQLLVRSRHVWQFSFSPDGRAIAYARGNGRGGGALRSDIFAVGLSDRVTTRLTHDAHSEAPLWGPRWIVYRRFRWEGGLRPNGRLWIMRADGADQRLLARGSERLRNGFPVFGLDPLALSDDGRHLLACQAFEFGCPRVTVTIPGGRRYGFPKLAKVERKRGATAEDLSSDGTRVLVDVGSPHDDRNHGIYQLPFTGGPLRLVARNAIQASWRH
jgi:Tol biopolymer transport system component